MCCPTPKDPTGPVRRTDSATRSFGRRGPLWPRTMKASRGYNAVTEVLCPAQQLAKNQPERVVELVRHPLF